MQKSPGTPVAPPSRPGLGRNRPARAHAPSALQPGVHEALFIQYSATKSLLGRLTAWRRGTGEDAGGFEHPLEKRTRSIRHQKILIGPERESGTPAVRRYRPSRPWPVGGLALVAAVGAVLTTGTLSSALNGGADPAFAARIEQGIEPAQSAMAAHAAIPAAIVPRAGSSAPRPAGVWQIQVGAFRNALAGEAHLRALESEVPELAQLSASHQLRGDLNRVRIGGIDDETAARELCARILAVGRGCFVAGPES